MARLASSLWAADGTNPIHAVDTSAFEELFCAGISLLLLLDLDLLFSLFSQIADAVAPKSRTVATAGVAPSGPTLIDLRRSNNISIVLAKFQYSSSLSLSLTH